MSALTILPNCRIGDGSLYDVDMDLIENLVKIEHGVATPEVKRSVELYYESRMLSYWSHFHESVLGEKLSPLMDPKMGGELDEKLFYFNYQRRTRTPEENDEMHRREFEKNYEMVRREFHQYEKLYNHLMATFRSNPSLVNIQQMFTFLAGTYCFVPIDEIDESLDRNSSMWGQNPSGSAQYPYPNGLGLFALNSYLFAAVHGVLLVGVPDRIQGFDGIVACPNSFMLHDLGHSREISISDGIKDLYVKVMTNPDLSRLEKEIHCLILWMFIHETNSMPPGTTLDKFLKMKIPTDLYKFSIDHLREFAEEFVRFADMVVNDTTLYTMKHLHPLKYQNKTREDILVKSKYEVIYEFTLIFVKYRLWELYPKEIDGL